MKKPNQIRKKQVELDILTREFSKRLDRPLLSPNTLIEILLLFFFQMSKQKFVENTHKIASTNHKKKHSLTSFQTKTRSKNFLKFAVPSIE